MSYEILQKEFGIEEVKGEKFLGSSSIGELIVHAFQIGLLVAKALIEGELKRRAEAPSIWPKCPKCGGRVESKGFLSRRLMTLVGEVSWSRRVGRCSNRCKGVRIAPLDQALGLEPGQKTQTEFKELACLLAIFIPYQISAVIFEKLLGFSMADTTIWSWVQDFGKKAMTQLDAELERYQKTGEAPQEEIPAEVLKLKCLMGADGVFAPFRPHGGSPQGNTVWKEVKIGVITRLKERLNREGKPVVELVQRRLVAVLGDVSQLAKRLVLEHHKQGVSQSSVSVWVSDGGKWLWGIFQTCFSLGTLGILDFYHSSLNLWKGAAAWLDGRTTQAREWFVSSRHSLRQGQTQKVLEDLEKALAQDLTPEQENTLNNVKNYLTTHLKHIQYESFKQQDLPIGSGFVESACKWLIQQRFMCVGMRWSEDGFSHLLHLRLLWVNHRWEPLFKSSPIG